MLWAFGDPARLSRRVAEGLSNPENDVYVSPVCIWEMVVKERRGRLRVDLGQIGRRMDEEGFIELPVRTAHVHRLRTLPEFHHDPFDRMLIAQALEEGLTLVTRDAAMRRYDVPILWE